MADFATPSFAELSESLHAAEVSARLSRLIEVARAGRCLKGRRYPAMFAGSLAYTELRAEVCPFDRPGEDDQRAGWERGQELARLLKRPTISAAVPMTHAARVAEAMERESDDREDAA